MSGDVNSDATGPLPSDGTGTVSYAISDQILWRQFREAENAEGFVRAWLALQCRFIDGAVAGVVVLGEPDVGPFAPAAFWPEDGEISAELSSAGERAMAERQGVVVGRDAKCVAHPLIIDGRLYGVGAISVAGGHASVRDVMRQLQWGAGWIEQLLLKEQGVSDAEQRERTGTAFDLLASVLEQKKFKAACTALVTELAMRMDCDPVSIGFVRRRRCVVAAISHASGFGKHMSVIRDIGAAMDEAVDQQAVVLYPPREGWEYRVTLAHAELAGAHKAGSVLTVPLQAHGELIGAITFQRPPGSKFDEATVDICDAVASVVGPVLAEKRSNDRFILSKAAESLSNQLKRLLGPNYFGRKLATLIAVLVVGFFSVATDDYNVTSSALLEGSIQRTVVAPFNGYLTAEHARAGEIVRKGQLLATLDSQDLLLERLRWRSSRQQRVTEYDRALATRELAEANIILAQIQQAEVQLALIKEQLVRTRITAPFAGVVVIGDLSQSVGASIERGQELFKIAPLNAYRVILEVDERDISKIEIGQTGILRLSSIPEKPQPYRVERISPISEQAEGKNFFRVEAALDRVTGRLRPGMVGVAKTEIGEQLLIHSWTERLVDWVYLAVWQWLP